MNRYMVFPGALIFMDMIIAMWRSMHDGCKHLNVAANVCDYTPVNLGLLIKNGILSGIESIHRETINRACRK